MSKRKPSYTRDNVQCNGKRAYVEARGLTMGPCEVKGAACILVTLKQVAPRNKWEREFCHWCVKLGLQVRECTPGTEATFPTREWVEESVRRTGRAVFEVYGEPDAIAGFVELPCVERWDWMLSGGPNVRISVQGAGPEKVKNGPQKAKPTVVYFPTEEDRGAKSLPNDMTIWESHTDAMGNLVKGCASLPE